MFNKKENDNKVIINYEMIKKTPNFHYIKPLNRKLISNIKFGNEILQFSDILLSLKDIDFSFFYFNIDNLKIQNIGGLIQKNARAGYSVRYNYIGYKDYFDSHEICHELLHLSSSIYDPNNYMEFCGFSQYNYKTDLKIGTALNEGYTEYLNEKIFGNLSNTYIIEKNLSSCIETIVGPTLMKRMFFKANLKGLIDILKNYNSLDETIKFIQSMDYISNSSNDLFSGKKLNNTFYKNMDFIIDYLITTYLNKLEYDLNINIINKDEYNDNLEKYLDSLGTFDYKFENKNYSINFISNGKITRKLKRILKTKKKK